MKKPQKWVDNYYLSQERIVLTENQFKVPGIRILAKHTIHSALKPLVLHYHENAFEFTLLTEGNLTFSTEKSDYRFSGGDVFISYPNEPHSTNETPLTYGEVYWFQLDMSDYDQILFLEPNAAAQLVRRLQDISHHVVNTGHKEISQHIKNAFRLALSGGDPYTVAAYITLFLQLLIIQAEKTAFNLTPDIGNSLNYILDNITEHLSLEELAGQCMLSASAYKQKFKKQVGISPRNFINQQKVHLAKAMLADGISITDTAMSLGFDTSSYFSVVFKKYTTRTPSAYQRTHPKP